jgi:hypothetical protein
MSNQSATTVKRLWNYCCVLRDDNISQGGPGLYGKQPVFFAQSKVDAVLIKNLEEVLDELCKWLIH